MTYIRVSIIMVKPSYMVYKQNLIFDWKLKELKACGFSDGIIRKINKTVMLCSSLFMALKPSPPHKWNRAAANFDVLMKTLDTKDLETGFTKEKNPLPKE